MNFLTLLDYASVLVFALTGALVASRAQLDIVGFAFVACLTAVGGGTIRDLLLDRHPVFWVGEPTYILLASAAAVLIFFTAHRVESRQKWLIWLDSFALAVAVSAGTGAAMELDKSPVIVVLMGMATGSFGGLMRDVVCNEVPLVLKQGELYMTCAMAGAMTAVSIKSLGMTDDLSALIACAVVCWALRAGSIHFGWHLPVYKSRPPRS
ncbi:trimeric intracellular cation channel family protein [Parasedimentitalea marina]|uniref:Trimeric intracellular cation channel family protein n=1 Tax=Parasedimentitalea marina TaxID=2483033 RepID=A0A3T0MXX2_9RHOB|nr:trimeric intracellular cation channel family protein [Parasedimentitalea marina]AZV76615.1 trimeric intracellular cation channel family protein [Parasedimentitalea marina]